MVCGAGGHGPRVTMVNARHGHADGLVACRCSVHLQVNNKGQICGATMEGAAGVDTSMLQAMMAQAQKLGPQLLSAIAGYVDAASSA